MDYYKIICEKVPREERLAGLAEEAAELAQAALKMRRVLDGSNPTPVSYCEAYKKLTEEIADVLLCIDVLGYFEFPETRIYGDVAIGKAKRWAERLLEREGG